MPHDVVMPQLGLTMTEGTVTSWQKLVGDRVRRGEVLFLVETDKVEMEVESLFSGYLQAVFVEPGRSVPVGTLIARIGEEQKPAEPECAVTTPGRPTASPRARAVARELGVPLEPVQAALGRRLTERDIRQFAAASASPPEPLAKSTPALREAPHVYIGVGVLAGPLVALRSRLLARDNADVRITYTDLFIAALARAISQCPGANARWEEGRVVANASVDIAFAVQSPDRSYTPVIRGADILDIAEIARSRCSLADKARTGRLASAEPEGASATVSNLASFGVDWVYPILNSPQSMILGVGRIADSVRASHGQVTVEPSVNLTMAADHRVLDGAGTARVLRKVKDLLEELPWTR